MSWELFKMKSILVYLLMAFRCKSEKASCIRLLSSSDTNPSSKRFRVSVKSSWYGFSASSFNVEMKKRRWNINTYNVVFLYPYNIFNKPCYYLKDTSQYIFLLQFHLHYQRQNLWQIFSL